MSFPLDRRTFFQSGVLAAGMAASGAAAAQQKPSFEGNSLLKPGATVLLQGDSITDAGRKKNGDLPPNDQAALGKGYAFLTAAHLLAGHPDADLKIHNRGISGNKVHQLDARWQPDCIDLKPDVLSILIGVNDIWHHLNGQYDGTVDTYRNDYHALMKRTKEALPDVKIVICEPFVLKTGAVDDKWFPSFDEFRAAAKEVADEHGDVWVPYQTMFDEAVKLAPPEHWARDGVHPSDAAADASSPAGREAVGELAQLSWYPLYAFLRRSGHGAHEAEDLVQGFFARLVEKQLLAGLSEGRGRFRNYLLVCLKRYVANEHERQTALKRGGGDTTLPLALRQDQWRNADERYQIEPASPNATPDRIYQRRWALAMLDRAMSELEAAWDEAGKQQQFAALRVYLTGDAEAPTHAEVATQLGISAGAVKTAVHRLRSQFRELLCQAVAETLDRDELLEDELQLRLMIATRHLVLTSVAALFTFFCGTATAALVSPIAPGDIIFNEFFEGWHKLDPNTHQVTRLPWPVLRNTVEIQFDTDGAILYDTDSQIQRLNPLTGHVRSLKVAGLQNVDGFVVQPTGDLLIANNLEVSRYSRTTGVLSTLATETFFAPAGIAQSEDGRVFITEFFENLREIDPMTGGRSLVTSAELSIPSLIAVRSDGDLIVKNFSPSVLYRIDPDTGTRTLFSDDLPTFPSEFTLDAADNLWLTSTDGIYYYDKQGGVKTLVASGTFFSPKGIAVVPDGWTPPPVQEPSTIVLAAIPMAAMVCIHAHRRRQ
ncbi:Acetylxylan esterase (Acetyl-xylooligosaccharide esterase) [Durusdinium trenchii]|uniref:Acetylxylan esterase (Acetyl-xylooligosaccharide esterase) n=1 Tax=Durusdinium trenchii TaxID=1381693 RepID=A0ABP0LEF4_9DINO